MFQKIYLFDWELIINSKHYFIDYFNQILFLFQLYLIITLKTIVQSFKSKMDCQIQSNLVKIYHKH